MLSRGLLASGSSKTNTFSFSSNCSIWKRTLRLWKQSHFQMANIGLNRLKINICYAWMWGNTISQKSSELLEISDKNCSPHAGRNTNGHRNNWKFRDVSWIKSLSPDHDWICLNNEQMFIKYLLSWFMFSGKNTHCKIKNKPLSANTAQLDMQWVQSECQEPFRMACQIHGSCIQHKYGATADDCYFLHQ